MTARIVRALFLDENQANRLALLRLINGYASAIAISVNDALIELKGGGVDFLVIGSGVVDEKLADLRKAIGSAPYIELCIGSNGLCARASWIEEISPLAQLLKPLPSLLQELLNRIAVDVEDQEQTVIRHYKAIVVVDENKLIEGMSPSAEMIFDCSSKEVLGLGVVALLPHSLELQKREIINTFATRRDGTSFEVELVIDELNWEGHRRDILTLRDLSVKSTPSCFIYDYAVRDELTGLYHRRSLRWMLSDALVISDDHAATVAVLIVDISHLNLINEMHGRSVGDQVLCRITNIIQAELRDMDHVLRYGGDQLLVILQQSSQRKAMATAERIRRFVDHNSITVGRSGHMIPVRVSISIGAAFSPQQGGTIEMLIDAARRALKSARFSLPELTAQSDI